MVLVVGGHSRNIGKTSVVEGLIRRFPQKKWTALKITQYGHGGLLPRVRSLRLRDGAGTPVRPQRGVRGRSDRLRRFLAAGAERSLWLRTPMGELARRICGDRPRHECPLWEAVARGVWDHKPRFVVESPNYVTAAVSEFVRSRLSVEPSR